MSVFIIAEAGVNHNGNLDLAFKLIDAAKKAGADCVKFQTYVSENLVSCTAPKAEYQKKVTKFGSQQEMLKKMELSFSDFNRLKEYCDQIGICFLSTPFDLESIAFLNTLDMPFWKIPSGEITDLPYLLALGKTKKPVILSTGMCTMYEIGEAVSILRENGIPKIILLHCNTEYPTPFEDVNLRAMLEMKKHFQVEVGYSDHTQGIEASIAAAALGAAVIEKHFTLDKHMEGPDHKASLEQDELSSMIASIRNIEKAIGTGTKTVSSSELKNKIVVRKSIVAKTFIKKGEFFSEDNITTKRPGNGISPMKWYQVLGTKALRDFREDELIEC